MAAGWDIPWRYGSPSGSDSTPKAARPAAAQRPPSPKKPSRGKVRARSTSINRVCLNSSWMLPLIRSTAAIRSGSYSSAVTAAPHVDGSRGHVASSSVGCHARCFRSSATPAAAAAPAEDAADDGEGEASERCAAKRGGAHVCRDDAAQLPLRRHAPAPRRLRRAARNVARSARRVLRAPAAAAANPRLRRARAREQFGALGHAAAAAGDDEGDLVTRVLECTLERTAVGVDGVGGGGEQRGGGACVAVGAA